MHSLGWFLSKKKNRHVLLGFATCIKSNIIHSAVIQKLQERKKYNFHIR